MKCEICKKGMAEMATLHRVNELGVTGIWRCTDCLTPEQRAAIDPETSRIVRIIEEGNALKGKQ